MNLRTALALGRVSNLPTVWTNGLAGIVLAGGALATPEVAAVLLGLSLLYVAGMFLNDTFDRDFDRRHRPERPIPSGVVSAGQVFGIGFGLLAAGVAVLAAFGWPAAAMALAGTIVLYDTWHKGNPASPAVMGACRLLTYVSAGLAVAPSLSPKVLVAALVSFAYLIGLTYVAKQETLQRMSNLWPLVLLAAPLAYGLAHAAEWPLVAALSLALLLWVGWAVFRLVREGRSAIPRTVVWLIAGISLVDAIFAAAMGASAVAALAVAVAAFGLTLLLQRWVART